MTASYASGSLPNMPGVAPAVPLGEGHEDGDRSMMVPDDASTRAWGLFWEDVKERKSNVLVSDEKGDQRKSLTSSSCS